MVSRFLRFTFIILMLYIFIQNVNAHTCTCWNGATVDVGTCFPLCSYVCAQACGGLTNCACDNETDCRNCCRVEACSIYTGVELDVCMDSCAGTCLVNDDFCQTIDLLRFIAIGIATVLFAVNGVRWIISEDDLGRMEARRGLLWIVFGLIVILVAFSLVNYIMVGSLACSC